MAWADSLKVIVTIKVRVQVSSGVALQVALIFHDAGHDPTTNTVTNRSASIGMESGTKTKAQ